MELDDTALVRPSKLAPVRRSGSAGSTTIADKPLEIQRRCKGKADKPAAEDDHVRSVHRALH